MNEEVQPAALSGGFVGVDSEEVRDNINSLLAGITGRPYVNPYMALQRVAKTLAYFHIVIPQYTFTEGEHGMTAFPIDQFGMKVGMNDQGEMIKKPTDNYYVYFEWMQNNQGMFETFCEVVTQDELDEIMDDIENEDDDEEVSSSDLMTRDHTINMMRMKSTSLREETLTEKAVSKAQQRFFGLVRGIQKGTATGSHKATQAAIEMSPKSVRDYAVTKQKGLPEKVKKNLEENLDEVKDSLAAFEKRLTRPWKPKESKWSKEMRGKQEKILKQPAKKKIDEEQLDEIKRSTARAAEKKAKNMAANPHLERDDEGVMRATNRDSQWQNIRRMRIDRAIGKKAKLRKEEQLDEISGSLVGNAAETARKRSQNAADDGMPKQAKAYADQANRLRKKADKKLSKERAAADLEGISSGKRAKMHREETLDEISKAFAGRVAKAASKDMKGMKRGDGGPTGYETWHNERRQKLVGKAVDKLTGAARVPATEETEQLNEIGNTERGRRRLKQYVKDASHSVATLSAATRGFARDADAQRNAGKPMDSRKSSEKSERTFQKSWRRRKGIARAVDRLEEDQVNELTLNYLTHRHKHRPIKEDDTKELARITGSSEGIRPAQGNKKSGQNARHAAVLAAKKARKEILKKKV